MVLWLMHINHLDDLYKSYGRKKIIRGHLGSQGSKGHFTQNCYFFYRSHGMVLWLMHNHQLDTLYKINRFKIHPGSFGVTGVKRSLSPKMLFLLQSTWYGHAQGLILHQFLSHSSSFFFYLSTCQYLRHPKSIMLILGQSNKSVNAHFWHDQFGVKGHDGVTGVKKVIFTKIAFSSTDHMVWYCDSCIFISYIPFTKNIGLKFTRGHLGSQGSKGHFHQKCYFSFRVHGMVMQLMHIDQLDTLYKSYRIKNSSGVAWGYRGQKVIFTKKPYF